MQEVRVTLPKVVHVVKLFCAPGKQPFCTPSRVARSTEDSLMCTCVLPQLCQCGREINVIVCSLGLKLEFKEPTHFPRVQISLYDVLH